MKHFYWIAATIALFFIGDRIAGYSLAYITQNSGLRYSRLYNNKAQADILLMGNSRGLTFFQPAIEEATGSTTFNLSYNAMPINLGKILVEDYLDHYPAPKVALIDVTMCDRYNNALCEGFAPYTTSSERIATRLRDSCRNSYYGGFVTNLYRYNNEIFQRVLYYRNHDDEDWLLDREISNNMQKDIVSVAPYNISIIQPLLSELQATVKALQAKGTTVRLTINPYYPPFAKKIENLEIFKQAVENATGLAVHNYAFAVNDPKYFGDYQHLNVRGAKVFIDILKKDGIFDAALANNPILSN